MPTSLAAPLVKVVPALALLVASSALAPAAAVASTDDGDGSPVMARLFVGLESGLSVAVATPDRALTAEVGQAYMPTGPNHGLLTEASLAARTSRVGGWLGARIGYQLGVFDYGASAGVPAARDVSHTGDIGVLVGATSESGHSLALELGVEEVRRAPVSVCCDTNLATASRGNRIVLVGEYALGDRVGLFTRVGARLADHIPEIALLPILMLGVQVNL